MRRPCRPPHKRGLRHDDHVSFHVNNFLQECTPPQSGAPKFGVSMWAASDPSAGAKSNVEAILRDDTMKPFEV